MSVSKILAHGKGQLISKCPFGVIVWTKIPTKKFDKYLPLIFKYIILHFAFFPHCSSSWHLFPFQQSWNGGIGRSRGSWGTFPKCSSNSFPKTFWISKQERNKPSRISFCIVIWSDNQQIMLIVCKTTISRFIKGQLNSKWPFGVIVWTKIPTKFFPGFLP